MNMDLNELINLLDDNQKIKLSENEIPEGFSPPPEMVLKPLVGKDCMRNTYFSRTEY